MKYHYRHLNIEEREEARGLRENGVSFRKIAEILGRSASTISREFKRNATEKGRYSAHNAQRQYKKRKQQNGQKNKLENEEVLSYVKSKLILYWSPEQISNRAKLEKKAFSVSYSTIYRALDKGLLEKSFKKYMRFRWMYKKETKKRKCKFHNRKSVHERSEIANKRLEIGHWESDSVFGKRNTGALATHVERVSGFLISSRIPNTTSSVFVDATVKAFKKLPKELKKSFTVDNGSEFLQHERLCFETNMDVYFCDPQSPWQRGSNENTNGLLRQFFPKKTSFANIENDLEFAVELINSRPRKRLGWRTPYEVLQSILQGCCTYSDNVQLVISNYFINFSTFISPATQGTVIAQFSSTFG